MQKTFRQFCEKVSKIQIFPGTEFFFNIFYTIHTMRRLLLNHPDVFVTMSELLDKFHRNLITNYHQVLKRFITWKGETVGGRERIRIGRRDADATPVVAQPSLVQD